MQTYLVRRMLLFIPTLLAVSIIIFSILRVIPGDVAVYILVGGGEGTSATAESVAAFRRELGLDKPLHLQYMDWVVSLAQLDLGKSLFTRVSVAEELLNRFPVTIELALIATVISVLTGVPLGLLSAIRQDTWLDHIVRFVSIGGVTIPNFWLATLVILALVTYFRWIPPLGFPSLAEDPIKNLQIMILPSFVLGYHFAAYLSRMTRSSVLEVLRNDYVRTAWSKGLAERVVVVRHVLRNALLPIVTVLGFQFGVLLSGTVVVETIFVIPGVGLTLIDAISTRDYPVVQALIVLFAFVLLVINLVVDVLYGWLDPRIRYS